MSGTNNKDELIPSARRLVTSLRDLGYDFSSAVADIIDNSIAAKATTVHVDIQFDGDNSWVRIADNGTGMDGVKLRRCMRYGSDRDYQDDDLGKFGLGLKTASLSQCQRLTVATRMDPLRPYIIASRWDLHHIQKTDRWEIIKLRREEMPADLVEPLLTSKGTVILWERLDRMLGYEYPYGEYARKRLLQMCRELETHLAMVFHRFLSGEVKRRRLKIYINGNPVSAWDPFARSEVHTKCLPTLRLPVEQDGLRGEITIEPYILPHQDRFSSNQAHLNAAGPAKWNRQQGFYIYRANRMIQSGGWCKLRTLDEHTKLARLALSFTPELDEAFRINVAKMRVQLPVQIRPHLEKLLMSVIKAAQSEYRKVSAVNIPAGEKPSLPPQEEKRNSVISTIRPVRVQAASNNLTPESLLSKLMALANEEERATLLRLLERFRKTSGINLTYSSQ